MVRFAPLCCFPFSSGLLLSCAGFCLFGPSLLWAGPKVSFEQQIAPLFEAHCIQCHAAGSAKGDVSLSTADDLKSQGYVIPGDPENSPFMELILPLDGERPQMPKDQAPLSENAVALFRQWIVEGAEWPANVQIQGRPTADATWWSFQPIDETHTEGTIDELVRARLAEHGLTMNPPADRRTLIRRATYDLIGLPPTPDQVEAFVRDSDPRAYEKLIDRLLKSPHYGERWGRHWLDVVRFGESIGFERNVIIDNIWPFRDYVIRSLNMDKPFDDFIREHIAGDVIGAGDPHVAVGSAFLVAGPYDDVGNQDAAQAAQIRANTLDEIIRATGEAFMGLTIGCARCHHHKFDPIGQEDYYALYATFAGVRHGAVELTTAEARDERERQLQPLMERRGELETARSELREAILERGRERLAEYEQQWTRPQVNRSGTEDRFAPVRTRFVRLVCESQDSRPDATSGFGIDEFEVWSVANSVEATSTNVALAINGGKATGAARHIEDFPDAYGPQLAIDGATGARFIAASDTLTIQLAQPTQIDRVVFSSAKNGLTPQQAKFTFVAEYRIEVSDDGNEWQVVADGHDRQPVNREGHLDRRLFASETTPAEQAQFADIDRRLGEINRQIRKLPKPPTVWIGMRDAGNAQGPFHVFLGGDPQQPGEAVVPASLAVLREVTASEAVSTDADATFSYRLERDAPEAERRRALADWLVHPRNPLTPRVLANRLWHYHFGRGIVATPSDFGMMGSQPTHPRLLDYLASQLLRYNWRIKPLHRMIMLSETYRQSSAHRPPAAEIDSESRWLWRYPPRRLSAEEIRDTLLQLAGKLKQYDDVATGSEAPDPVPDGGPGFRLYHFMQDNVCTYVPLDHHGPETYRRAVYHQNARASVVDLMTDFDQPDCTFSAPKRAATTTPLQALTLLNHRFTLDMANAMADRIQLDSNQQSIDQVKQVFRLCYHREPSEKEVSDCGALVETHGLAALCRVLINTSELIYVR